MRSNRNLTKALAILGTVLAWLPIAFTLGLAVASLIERGQFLFDYLAPAELFPIAFVGGALLLWAALREKSLWQPVAWSLALMVLLLVGGQALAVVTGLADGSTPIGGWQWMMVLAALIGYVIALIVLAGTGIALVRQLLRPPWR